MQIKHKRNGVYEHLYPKTLSENVEMNDGNNVEQWKKEVEDDLNDVKEVSERLKDGLSNLWSGSKLMDSNDVVRPRKKLSECFTGWILVWKRAGSRSQFQYTVIPKIHVDVISGSTGGTKSVLSTIDSKVVIKYIYIVDDEITGHGSNTESDNSDIELAGVYEF